MGNEDFKTTKYRKRFKELSDEYEKDGWRKHLSSIADFMVPRKAMYLQSEKREGSKAGNPDYSKIINGVAGKALGTLAAGMMSGLTSSSLQWFTLDVQDRELMEIKAVRLWLDQVTKIMLRVYQKSNFYSAIHGRYAELSTFGTAAMIIEEDFQTGIRVRPLTVGEYYIALDSKYRPDTLYRQFSLTARQIVEEFGGEEGEENENISIAVRNSVKTDKGDARFEIVQCIQPRDEFEEGRKDIKGKAYESIYFELDEDNRDKFLREEGYSNRPFVAPRWEVVGTESYGNSPAMDTLGDVKMLQKMEEKKLKALDKLVDPPMIAGANLKGKHATIIAGGVTYDDSPQGAGFRPAYQVNPDMGGVSVEIRSVEERIKEGLFNDLFLSILAEDKRMTATEVRRRHSEKMVILGPVLQRLQYEMLGPVIERTYLILDNLGMIPPQPLELQGKEVEVKYISVLAQAQRAAGVASIEQTAGFVGHLIEKFPTAGDKFDANEAIDQYARDVNCPPAIIRSDREVAGVQQQRAAAQAKAQQREDIEAGVKGAQGAKLLSETNAGGNSVLDQLLGVGA